MIKVQGVSKSFAGRESAPVHALSEVDVEIGDNEFFTLLGPSGCGKTTLLRLIGGFESPSSGSIRIGDLDVGALPPQKRPVNTVFQSYALFPHMTAAENVAFGLEMLKVPREQIGPRVAETLAMVRLGGLANRKPGELSGGQQQRVALARALAPRPAVLLLDEPLSALDLKLRREMQSELKRLQRETGITFVLVTHDQEEALAMSDRIAVMRDGRILQVGTPKEIYDFPNCRFVADFIGEANLIPGGMLGRDTGLTVAIRARRRGALARCGAIAEPRERRGGVRSPFSASTRSTKSPSARAPACAPGFAATLLPFTVGDRVAVDWPDHLERELPN